MPFKVVDSRTNSDWDATALVTDVRLLVIVAQSQRTGRSGRHLAPTRPI